MKKVFKATTVIVVTAMAVAMVGCEQFSASYNRIEETEFRLLDFKYELERGTYLDRDMADIAPGDNMILTAVFAGKRVEDLDSHLDWWISFNMIRDLLGTTTVVDSVPLMSVPGVVRIDPAQYRPILIIGPPDREGPHKLNTQVPASRPQLFHSENTMTVAFRIPIPKDIMRKSAAIPEAWTQALPAEIRSSIPSELASLTKDQIIDAIEAYIEHSPDAGGIDLGAEYSSYLRYLMNYFTVPIRVSAKVKMDEGRLPHTIRSTHHIRYNRHFETLGVPVNTNPRISRVVAFKVKGNIGSFHDKSGYKAGENYDTLYAENGELTIPVESGYSYFLEAITDGSYDSTITMFGNRVREDHYVYWQYHVKDSELAGVKRADYMDFFGGTGQLIPPGNRKIENFILWTTVVDDVMNERFRPQGGTFAEVKGRFVYK